MMGDNLEHAFPSCIRKIGKIFSQIDQVGIWVVDTVVQKREGYIFHPGEIYAFDE
jgi:hypothetical protein